MNILVIGGRGFIGSEVVKQLSDKHEVTSTCIEDNPKEHELTLNLKNLEDIGEILQKTKPDIIVNCAGVVANDETAELNYIFTKNILTAINKSGINPEKVIIMGSAGEYGEVSPNDLPADENTPLRATNMYGRSKVKETSFAYEYSKQNNINLIVARIFNPVGINMAPRMLISGLLRQAKEIKSGTKESIEVSRLDSERDYIDVRDVAKAIEALIINNFNYNLYNIGTGVATTNEQIVKSVISAVNLPENTSIIETSADKEMPVASRADISRIQNDTGWSPIYTPGSVIKEMLDGTKTI